MKIFVRGLPQETPPLSLQAFAETLLERPWYMPWRNRFEVKSCVVYKMTDLQLHSVEFHGVLDVVPPKAGQEAIARLNGKVFMGRRLLARKWQERSDLNERRNIYAEQEDFPEEQRRGDRRRSQLVIETFKPLKSQGMRQFHREMN